MVRRLERDLPELLSFFALPRHLWRKLRTTNVIERCFVEVRRRTRPMVCFVNVQSVDRIIYSIFQRFNLQWKTRTLNAIYTSMIVGQCRFRQRQRQERTSRPERSWHPFGLQYAGMKPCVCNGSNANCRYCSGSGYVPDEERLPKGIRKNPYIGMKPSTPPQLDPKIEDEIVRGILAREAERNRLEARREEGRKRALVGAVLLFVILLLVLFFRR